MLTKLLMDNVIPVVREEIMVELNGQNLINTGLVGGVKDDIRNRYMVRDPNDAQGTIRIEE